jgi:hypothetical protein
MDITVTLPDELVAPLLPPGESPAQAALQALALEAYRQRRITPYQLRTVLGISSRYEPDGFLKLHRIDDYTPEDFDQDWNVVQKLASNRAASLQK